MHNDSLIAKNPPNAPAEALDSIGRGDLKAQANRELAAMLITPSSRSMLEAIGMPAIADWIAQAWTIQRIARTIGAPLSSVAAWLNEPERIDQYQAARAQSAGVMQDASTELLEALEAKEELTTAAVMLAKLRVSHNMQLAGLRDRTQSANYTPPEEIQRSAIVSGGGNKIFVIHAAPSAPRLQRTVDTIDGE